MADYPYSLTVTNPGAETGDTTGWTNIQGTLVAIASGGGNTPRSGSFMFRAGASLATKAYQDVDIPGDLEADVDAGVLRITAGGYHSGFTDADGGWLSVWPLDASDRRIGQEIKSNFIHDGVNAWALRSCEGRIPEGTRKLRFTQLGWRDGGTNLDSYWDDLFLTVTYTTESIRQTVNGCIYHDKFQWATGTLTTPWTVISGTWTVFNSGIPDFFSSVRPGMAADNERMVYADHDAVGSMVVQSQYNNTTVSGTTTFPGVMAREDATATDGYLFIANPPATGTVQLLKQVAGVFSVVATQSLAQVANTEYEFKGLFEDGSQKLWVDGSLVITATDTTHDGVMGYGGYRSGRSGVGTKEIRYDEYTICKSNSIICTNLPTGCKFRVTGPIVDGGANTTKVATESGGTATVDCDNLWFPANKVEVLDASDNILYSLSQSVWGGDEYTLNTDIQQWMAEVQQFHPPWEPLEETVNPVTFEWEQALTFEEVSLDRWHAPYETPEDPTPDLTPAPTTDGYEPAAEDFLIGMLGVSDSGVVETSDGGVEHFQSFVVSLIRPPVNLRLFAGPMLTGGAQE